MPPLSDAALSDVDRLASRHVGELFEDYPSAARAAGDHAQDGEIVPITAPMLERRSRRLRALLDEAAPLDAASLTADEACDLTTLRLRSQAELFEIGDLRLPQTSALWGLGAIADVSSYISRDYAPAADRARSLVRHLSQVPEALFELSSLLAERLLEGPRQVAIDSASGYAHFYRHELAQSLGTLPRDLSRRLATAIDAAAASCELYGATAQGRPSLPDSALGEASFLRYLEVSEGVRETTSSLTSRVETELDRLRQLATETAAEVSPSGDVGAAFLLLADDHPAAATLLPEAHSLLAQLHAFWLDRDVMTIPDAICEVRASPIFLRQSTAMFEPAGALAPAGSPNFYYVTTVQPDWNEQQADEWLRHLCRPMLENITVHEVYPGHYIQELHAQQASSVIRRVGYSPAWGEGWAHYAEELAIEQGLAEGRPTLRLAQIGDALLRACRYRVALGLHIEGRDMPWAVDFIMKEAYLARFPAEREALRGSYDPLYLGYCYGKLEIQRWRSTLTAGGTSLKQFHDTLLASGQPPLAAVGERVHRLLVTRPSGEFERHGA